MNWEKDPKELTDHLRIYVAQQLINVIPGGGFLGRHHMNRPKSWEIVLAETADRIKKRQPTKLTMQRAEEIAAENRKKKD